MIIFYSAVEYGQPVLIKLHVKETEKLFKIEKEDVLLGGYATYYKQLDKNNSKLFTDGYSAVVNLHNKLQAYKRGLEDKLSEAFSDIKMIQDLMKEFEE